MNYSRIGTAFGREIFVPGNPDSEPDASPQGFSIAAVVLKPAWKSDEVGWTLNELYGALADWTEFSPEAGARSFVFYGERADEASNLCDTFAYAWTKGAEQQYDDVIATSNDWPDLDAFVESMLSGEIAVGDAYADKIRNTIFAVVVSDPQDESDAGLQTRVRQSVNDGVQRHRLD
jgi:hypothetical protein